MINELIQFIKDSLAQNQFASGGILIVMLSSAMGLVYKVGPRILDFIKRKFVTTVDIQSNDEVFRALSLWLHYKNVGIKRRLLSASAHFEQGDDWEVCFSPGPGNHFFWYQGRLVWLGRNREKSQNEGLFIFHEEYSLKLFTRNVNIGMRLLNEAKEYARNKNKNDLPVYFNQWENWIRIMAKPRRRLESVILKDGMEMEIHEDMKWFLERRSWYVKRGVPYRRGYLFHGEPGTGKTSLIRAVASELELPIYFLNLSNCDDKNLISLFSSVPLRAVIVLEDIDTVFVSRTEARSNKADETNRVTFRGLLNVIDGVVAPEGVVLIMTTNYKDRLDPALIRPGRVDKEVEFGRVDRVQAEKLCRLFRSEWDGKAIEFATASEGLTPAELQRKLMQE